MMRTIRTLCLAVVMALAFLPGRSKGQQETDVRQERLRWMKQSVGDISVSLGDGSQLELAAEPLSRFSNPVSGVSDGTVFVWNDGKRPRVAVQVFRVADGTWLQEFQSLAQQPLTAARNGTPLWSPDQAGLTMRPAPGAPTPSDRKAIRLVQMRGIARQFTANDQFEDREPYHLRLLSTPLRRYAHRDAGVIDGGLFAFTHGTDPELLMLIEAVEEACKAVWKLGFAPMTSYVVEVQHRGEAFWKCDRRAPPNKISDTFFLHVCEDGP